MSSTLFSGIILQMVINYSKIWPGGACKKAGLDICTLPFEDFFFGWITMWGQV